MTERNYRDAVHNIIRVDTGTAEGELVARLIDAPEFQRLRRIRQLGLAYFAYQTAEHSRFTHSLGAFFLAKRVLDRLGVSCEISDEDKTAVKVAALLHDLGHGPFSHVIESILSFHHEDFTVDTVTTEGTAINRILSQYSAQLSTDVADIIRGKFRRRALGQLVSSQLDVDRMDYLLRDSLLTGVKYGVYDLEWVLKSIEIDEAEDHLFISSGGIYAVEDYLQARYYMFRQVYFHRTLRSAEIVLRSLLRRAINLFQASKPIWFASGTAFETILKSNRLSLDEHLSLDDADVLFHIKQWRRSDDKILADLSNRFLSRGLFKALDLDIPDSERQEFITVARKIVEDNGFDPEHYFFEDKAGEDPYFFYSGDDADTKDRIYVETGSSHRTVKEISDISSAVRGLQRGYSMHRICFPAEVRDQISNLFQT